MPTCSPGTRSPRLSRIKSSEDDYQHQTFMLARLCGSESASADFLRLRQEFHSLAAAGLTSAASFHATTRVVERAGAIAMNSSKSARACAARASLCDW